MSMSKSTSIYYEYVRHGYPWPGHRTAASGPLALKIDDDGYIPRNTPPPNTTHSSETPRSADTRVYRAGRYRPETHRYRRKG